MIQKSYSDIFIIITNNRQYPKNANYLLKAIEK